MTVEQLLGVHGAMPFRPFRLSIPVILAPVLGVAMFVLPFVSVRQTRSRMDAVTGSMEWQTTWPLGLTAGPKVDVSPVECRRRKMGVQWTPDWRFLHNTHRTILGSPTVYECGLAPPIHQLHSVLAQFVESSTDDEIRAFVGVMQQGADAEKRAAVETACDKALLRERARGCINRHNS
jgi:hypothetical protein